MGAHALLKNEFTEDEKYHNLMWWLIYYPTFYMKSSKVFLLYRVRSPFVHVIELFTGK